MGGWKTGFFTDKSTSAITAYNETTDSWEAMANSMPTARDQALVAILDGKMMVVGGSVGEGHGIATNVVEILC